MICSKRLQSDRPYKPLNVIALVHAFQPISVLDFSNCPVQGILLQFSLQFSLQFLLQLFYFGIGPLFDIRIPNVNTHWSVKHSIILIFPSCGVRQPFLFTFHPITSDGATKGDFSNAFQFSWSAVKPSKVNWENGRWQMGELNFWIFSGHGHQGECSTICPVSAALQGQMGESNFLILPCVQVMRRVWTNGRVVFDFLDLCFATCRHPLI